MLQPFRKRMHAGRWLLSTCLLAFSVPLLAATNAPPAATHAGPVIVRDLRVFYVRPRVFDYLFTGAISGSSSNTAPLLNFRDLAGNTPTVRIYESLGPYTVTNFTPRKTRVFKESVHASLDEDISTVTLHDATGSNRVLTVGQPLIESGQMACLISIGSGGWGHVHEGDALNIDGLDVTIVSVTTTAATLRANACEYLVPLVTDDERKAMLALWETHRREAEAQQAQALALVEEKRAQAAAAAAESADVEAPPPAKQAPAVPTTSFTFGYEGYSPGGYGGYYPTRFMMVPYTYYWPHGQTTTQSILVPAPYERHHGGDGHWRH